LELRRTIVKEIKERVLEIADIAKACPENLQAVCFETLLKHFLAGLEPDAAKPKKEQPAKQPQGEALLKAEAEEQQIKQEDLRDSDLHVKVKRFMQKEGVTLEQLNNLFFREGQKILPIFDDLKTTRMAESQIRVTLLQCLIKAIATGEFETEVETIRAECSTRKCYDSPNFTAIFRKNSSLFDFDKFDRKTKTVRLSDAGRKELAGIIKELQ
jgi:hypothetical protein